MSESNVRRYRLEARPQAGSPRILEGLNEAQRAAVESRASRILILAGAGSGKTRTLTCRVARLIERGAAPEGVVLVTFTHRAAREMIERLDGLLGPAARRVRAGTFHALAHRTLRRHGHALGLRSGFSILDRQDQRSALEAAVGAVEVDVGARRFPSGDALSTLRGLAIDCGLTLGEAIRRKFPHFAPLEPEIVQVLEVYAAKKQSMNAVDFDDLLVGWRELLAREDALGDRLRGEVEHVLVDEYQDTNPLQAEIAELLAARCHSLSVVGDDAQSIYGFRGADFENILEFPRVAPTEVHPLTTSYRSTPEIIALANAVIEHNPLQFPKPLSSPRESGPLPVLVQAKDAREQAAFIAQRILELRDEGVPLSAQAVLYRAASHSVELEVELARRDIPFILRSGIRFFERAHVRDALAFIRVVANPKDELGWQRVLDMVPHVGSKTADRILRAIAACEDASPAALILESGGLEALPPRARPGARAVFELIRDLEDLRSAPGAMFRRLLSGTRESTDPTVLVSHVRSSYEHADERLAELEQLAEIAAGEDDLLEFLGDTALVSAPTGEDVRGTAPDRERLTLSTVHQAKGLEWQVVFILSLTDGGFPVQPALEEPGGEAEERRLFYVAVTRARDQLYLSHPTSKTIGEDRLILRPSRFLSELDSPRPLIERWVLDPE